MLLMNNNIHRKLTTLEIARTVRLSPARLRELFKNQTGTSLARYHKRLRLEQAKRLLETTFLNVKEVVASVGLTSVAHFVGDFQKAYGATPARYAKRYRKAI